jgi:hypothetical protein
MTLIKRVIISLIGGVLISFLFIAIITGIEVLIINLNRLFGRNFFLITGVISLTIAVFIFLSIKEIPKEKIEIV